VTAAGHEADRTGGGTIDVDIGGTFTDCFVRAPDGRSAAVKTPTTGHRLSIGFMRGLRAAADELGCGVGDLLQGTDIIRYSTTVAMNTLLQRSGPTLALLVTSGFEDVLRIGKGASWMDAAVLHEIRNVARITKPEPLVPPELTLSVDERIDCFGNVLRPMDEDRLVGELRRAVDQGVRGFVVSLLFSYINPVHERRIRELIESEFPDSYLGAMPIMLSSDVAPKRWEYSRTNTTILNAYLHQSMWEELSGLNDELRDNGYRRGIMLVHNTGGMAEVYRTSAVQTYNGGPVAGLIGASAIGRRMGYENVLVTDMGGTSFDIGLVVKGSTRTYQFRPIIDRYWVDMSILETRSIGAGGGSIAWINDALGGSLTVGPRGAGSMPGPAAYGLGGTEPTVTDADVVLGYINPENYFGGKIRLSRDAASASIRTRIAEPLGLPVEEAALRIKRMVDANMADVIARETFLRGFDPADFIVFAYGGAGPTHCIGYSGELNARKLAVFPFSPIFCAWGSATMPTVHLYEKSRRLELLEPGSLTLTDDYATFNAVVEGLLERATRDLRGEGFDVREAVLSLALDMKYGGQIHIHRAASPRLMIHGPDDVRAIYDEFEREYADVFSPLNVYPEGGVEIHNFVLRAELPEPNWDLPRHPVEAGPADDARVGHRRVFWEAVGGFADTSIYAQELIKAGQWVIGPAVIEAPYTTTVVDPGYRLEADEHLTLLISCS
jgi:N-methylhydantoinase A/acetophenone carboxylase